MNASTAKAAIVTATSGSSGSWLGSAASISIVWSRAFRAVKRYVGQFAEKTIAARGGLDMLPERKRRDES
jgi:hypothetical protein